MAVRLDSHRTGLLSNLAGRAYKERESPWPSPVTRRSTARHPHHRARRPLQPLRPRHFISNGDRSYSDTHRVRDPHLGQEPGLEGGGALLTLGQWGRRRLRMHRCPCVYLFIAISFMSDLIPQTSRPPPHSPGQGRPTGSSSGGDRRWAVWCPRPPPPRVDGRRSLAQTRCPPHSARAHAHASHGSVFMHTCRRTTIHFASVVHDSARRRATTTRRREKTKRRRGERGDPDACCSWAATGNGGGGDLTCAFSFGLLCSSLWVLLDSLLSLRVLRCIFTLVA